MKIGTITDSLHALSFDQLFDTSAELGIEQLEFASGNWSRAPHLAPDHMLYSATARQAKMRGHGLAISALNCSGNPLHPGEIGERHREITRKTIALAGLMGIERVVMRSGCPGGRGDVNANWVTTSKHCRELHGHQNSCSAGTFFRLRDAVGEMVSINFDPSHLLWMGADPLAAIAALGPSIYYVHAKDTRLEPEALARDGRIQTRLAEDVVHRAWNYVTLGRGHDEAWRRSFCRALVDAGYYDVLSIEHEDLALPREGIARSAALLRRVLDR
jgi:sugar phosphate isomerase/epimerase